MARMLGTTLLRYFWRSAGHLSLSRLLRIYRYELKSLKKVAAFAGGHLDVLLHA